MKVELHLLQNVAPSCLNRDDTNTPKDCEFGGHRRARISSQALKRAIRLAPIFGETLESSLGIRTKGLVFKLTELLTREGKDQTETGAIATGFVEAAMSAVAENEQKTKVLLYLGEDEIQQMVAIILENYDLLLEKKNQQGGKKEDQQGGKKKKLSPFQDACKKAARGFQSGTKAADIALFGRMMAEHPEGNIYAACQVAHAISTNKVSMEMDYYTAVDDLSPREETGAGMLGFTSFNSSCFYRYATIDFDSLRENLSDDIQLTKRAVEAFIRASVAALPSGKQNSMAAHNPPEAIFAVVRNSGTPVSLANAFCKPIRPGHDSDLMSESIKAMDAYWGKLTQVYGCQGITAKAVCTVENIPLENLGRGDKKTTLEQVIGSVAEALQKSSNGEPA